MGDGVISSSLLTRTAAERPGASAAGPRRSLPSWAFVLGYTLAQIGGFVAFIDLLQVVIPIKAALIAPGQKTALLGAVTILGAVAASGTNILAGAASDRTHSRFGRRRPWMAVGLAGVVGAYAMIAWASNAIMLALGLIAFQIAFNIFYAPLGAIIADRVPDRHKGFVSAMMGLGFSAGTWISSMLVGGLHQSLVLGLALTAAVLVALILPFLVTLDDRPIEPRPEPILTALKPGMTHDLVIAVISRLGVFTGQIVILNFMLFNLRDQQIIRPWLPTDPEQALGQLMQVSAYAHAVVSLASGRLSDLWGHRRPFLVGAALTMAGVIVAAAFCHDWRGMVGLYVLLGAAMGCYRAIDGALMVQVLPSPRDAGRDLGWVNLSNTAPQIIASTLALVVVSLLHGSHATLFVCGAAFTAVGGLLALFIRGVK